MSIKKNFSKNLEKILQNRKFDYGEFAKRLNINRNTLYNYRKGERIDLDVLETIAKALEVSPLNLLYPGELPNPIRIEPTPLEALKIIEKALKEKTILPSDIEENISKLNPDELNAFWRYLRSTLDSVLKSHEDK